MNNKPQNKGDMKIEFTRKPIVMIVLSIGAALLSCPALGQPTTWADNKVKFMPTGEIEVIPSKTSSQNDFDYLVGKWKLENKKLKTRLNNCTEWIEFESTVEMNKFLQGIGNIDIYKATFDGKPFEGVALRLFNPKTKLWSIYWADSNVGAMDPPMVGSFEGNIGMFYAKDVHNGKPVIVMFHWDKTDRENPVWSQAFSPDNGKTWEWNFTNVSRRVK
jgi:hypothetical protein